MSNGHRRSGISLLEVLISIGVIALGIFGVATLIPVAQFKIAEGTSNDRQAAFGPSAVAQFRIQNMGAPENWLVSNVRPRGYCIDPLGLIENNYNDTIVRFPANVTSAAGKSFFMPRIGLKSLKYGVDGLPGTGDEPSPAVELALARNLFFLQDELEFDRPSEEDRQPNRQFFVTNTLPGKPVRSFATASLSWFATVSPTVIVNPMNPQQTVESDEFLLSIVVMKNRVPQLALTEENFASATCQYAGEIVLTNSLPVTEAQMKLSDLRIGDWLLLTKPVIPSGADDAAKRRLANDAAKRVYRWTQIIGTTDDESADANQLRTFTVSNDDFFRPGEAGGFAIFARGVKAVYERTIRLENTSAWN